MAGIVDDLRDAVAEEPGEFEYEELAREEPLEEMFAENPVTDDMQSDAYDDLPGESYDAYEAGVPVDEFMAGDYQLGEEADPDQDTVNMAFEELQRRIYDREANSDELQKDVTELNAQRSGEYDVGW